MARSVNPFRARAEVKVDALDARAALRTACDGGNTSGSRDLGYPHHP